MKNIRSIQDKDFLNDETRILNVSDLSEYAYCPRRFYLSRIKGIYKESVYAVMGRIEHDARRVLCTALKPLYEEVSNNTELAGFQQTCLGTLEKTLDYVRNVACLEYPLYTSEIGDFVLEMEYRLKKEENDRLRRAGDLAKDGMVGRELALQVLPLVSELSLFSSEIGLKGRVDQVFMNHGSVIPVDIKTTPFSFVYKDAHAVQIAAYGLLLEKEFGKKVDNGEIHYVRNFFHDEVPLTDQLRSKVFEMRDFILEIQDNDIPKPLAGVDLVRCNYCFLQRECSNFTSSEAPPADAWIQRLFADETHGSLDSLYSGAK